MKKIINNITQDGIYEFPEIAGDVKKICILSKEILNSVELTFTSGQGEILYKTNITNVITNLYPYNFIDIQGRGTEYFIDGKVFLKIEGLRSGQLIDSISIFFR